MKKVISSLILVFCMLGKGWAQGDTIGNGRSAETDTTAHANHNCFRLDVGTPKAQSFGGSLSKERLEANTSDLVSIQLVHANPFKYKYKISAMAVDLYGEAQNVLDTTTKASVATVSDANLSKNISGLMPVKEGTPQGKSEAKKAGTSSRTKASVTTSKEKDTTAAQNNAAQVVNLKNSIMSLDKVISGNYAKKEQDTITITADKHQDSITKQTAPPPVDTKRMGELTKRIEDTATVKEQLVAIWDKLLLSVDANLIQMQGLQAKIANYNMKLKTVDNFDIKYFRDVRDGFYNSFSQLIAEYNLIINDFNSRPFTDIQDKFAILQAKAAQYTALKEDCEKMLASYYQTNLNNYTLPLDVNGKNIDLVTLKLERLDPGSGAHIDTYEYQIWIKGGLKFDISAGGFLTSLIDKAYITENVTVDGVAKKRILLDGHGTFKLGFGSMVNMSYRTGRSWLRPAFSLGLVFTASESFQVLTGPSLVVGKMERVVLHGGLSIGNVAQLRPEYKAGQVYDLGESNTVPTTMVFKAGGFFGLTYNLTKVKAKNIGTEK